MLGVELDSEAAQVVSDWVVTQDCLPNYDSGQYVECGIKDAALRYGLDVDRFAALAWCESGHDPAIKNRSSSATGLYQFLTSTWAWVRDAGAPHAHEDRTHARANADTAAWLISRADLGGAGHWVCRY